MSCVCAWSRLRSGSSMRSVAGRVLRPGKEVCGWTMLAGRGGFDEFVQHGNQERRHWWQISPIEIRQCYSARAPL
jgi:hypothetical protein